MILNYFLNKYKKRKNVNFIKKISIKNYKINGDQTRINIIILLLAG